MKKVTVASLLAAVMLSACYVAPSSSSGTLIRYEVDGTATGLLITWADQNSLNNMFSVTYSPTPPPPSIFLPWSVQYTAFPGQRLYFSVRLITPPAPPAGTVQLFLYENGNLVDYCPATPCSNYCYVWIDEGYL